ncbi:SGNH/GDSL hydrolase family protein [Aquihabitans daechungensis]|uniref:SGNH/GDSL hydrolase family protein n=1 Tax=Aquihabitans daechungensis TaxID=1052257 RepID=UPI003B9FF774
MADHRGSQGCLGPIALVVVVVLGTFAAFRVLPDGPPPEQFVIGDSVTFLSAGAIDDHFDRNHLQLVARPGLTSTALLPLVEDAMGTSGDPAHARERVAVLVGYNDVRVREVDTPSLRAMVDLTSEFECGVWLTLPSRPGGDDATNPMASSKLVDEWNLRMQAEVERHDNLHLTDAWSQAVNNAPKGKLLNDDGVHPNAAGRALLAGVYRDAIDKFCE